MMVKVEIVKHYAIEDIDCVGDFVYLEIFINGNFVRKYGDNYHDEGQAKSEGFCDALREVYGEVELEFRNLADCEI